MKKFFFIVLDFLRFNTLLRFINRGQLIVLNYHSISEPGKYFSNAISEVDFERQLNHLQHHYNIVRLDSGGKVEGARSDRVNVLLTFDDGFIDNYHVVFPILNRRGLSGVFFLIAGCIPEGSVPNYLRKRYPENYEAPAAHYTINSHQAVVMHQAGMTVASHGFQHLDYVSIPVQEGLTDARCAQEQLAALILGPVCAFAFPWGKHQSEHIPLLLETYQSVFLTRHGFSRPDDRVFYRNAVANFEHMCCTASGLLVLINEIRSRPWFRE